MSNRSSDMTEGTLRQRRNLLITSIILIAYFYTGIELGSQLSILGATVTVGRPTALLDLIFVAHCYYWFRYYQYVHADPFYLSEKGRYKRLVYESEEHQISSAAIKAAGVSSPYPPFRSDFESVDGSRLKGFVKVPVITDGQSSEEKIPVEFDASFLNKKFHWGIAFQVFVKGKLVTDFLLPTFLASVGVMLVTLKTLLA